MVSENNLEEAVSVLKSDIRDFVRKTERKFDLIFLDPPYESTFYEEVIQNIYDRSLLQEDGLLVVEHSKRKDLSHLPHFEKVKDYGGVCFSFFGHSFRQAQGKFTSGTENSDGASSASATLVDE